jgi:hypothetical protein
MRLTLGGSAAFKLFAARVQYRTIGTYVEAYEAAAGAVWDSGPIDLGSGDQVLDQLRFEMDADGSCSVTLWTDLPGESLAVRFTATISTAGFGRRWVTMVLPVDTHGRIAQVIVSSSAAFRLYAGQLSKRTVGRYLAAGANDTYRSLDQDFGTERVKFFKKLEVDISTSGPVTLRLFTDGPSPLAVRYSMNIDTGGLRTPLKLRLPWNVRGRIARIEIGGAGSGRLFALRAWGRSVGESGSSDWSWMNFPVESSQALAEWAPLPIEGTPSEWQTAELPVEATSPEWEWVSFPVAPTGAQWTWQDVPVLPA